jgi:hypothetical protein
VIVVVIVVVIVIVIVIVIEPSVNNHIRCARDMRTMLNA